MMKVPLPDLRGKHRTETAPPEPHRLVADVDAPLREQIRDLSQRQRIADVHHHREADHLGRAVEIAEGIAHHQRLGMSPARLKPICSDNADKTPRAASASTVFLMKEVPQLWKLGLHMLVLGSSKARRKKEAERQVEKSGKS